MKLPRPAILVGALAAIVLVLIVFSVLLLPQLIDSQLIKEKISTEVTNKGRGRVTLGKVVLLWFPRPYLVIENAQVSMGESAQGSIRSAEIYPSILSLLLGRLVVRRALLREPKLSVRLPESSTTAFDLEQLEKQIRSALVHLTGELPAPRIDVSDGSAEIMIGDRAPIVLENITAQTVASPSTLSVEITARSSLWEGLKIEGRIASDSLTAQLNIGVQRLKIKESLALLAPQTFELTPQGEVNLEMKIETAGLRQVKGSIGGSTGPISFGRGGRTASVEVKRLKTGITYQRGAVQVDVEQLDLGSPRLSAAGQFKIHSGSLFALIKARDVDIAEIGVLAVRIVDDAEVVQKILRYLPAGKIPNVTIQSAGRSLTDMTLSKNVLISGLLSDGKVFIPGPDLDLQNVSGSVRISRGILEANNISANLGTMRGWSGDLRLGLEGSTAPFHLDIALRGSAPELHSVLLALVHDETWRGELLKVRNLEGELSGKLILGESLNAIAPIVAVSSVDLSATYAPMPFPIAIRGGRLHFDSKIIRVENAQASVGLSTFNGLDVTLHRDGSRQIKVNSKRILADLYQTDTLLRGFKDTRAYLASLQSMSGHIDLEKLVLAGAYDDPAGWTFASTGTLSKVAIRHADWPEPIALSRGKFDVNQGRIIVSDAAVTMSDADVIAGGTFEYTNWKPIQIEMNGMGATGSHMTEWLSRYVELPAEVKLRSPLRVTVEHLGWRAAGDRSFRGQVIVAGGPRITLEAVKHPQALAVQNLTIDDGERRARMTLQFAKDNLDGSFTGELTQQMIDRVFASSPIKAGLLRGDIKVSAVLPTPTRFSARGQLNGSNLTIPLGAEKVALETFSIESSDDTMLIRTADLRWRNSRFSLAGKVGGGKDSWRLDLDVAGDRLSFDELDHLFGRKDEPGKTPSTGALSLPRLEGAVRLTLDSFATAGFTVSALQMRTLLSSSLISAEIERGFVCGIRTTGRVEVADNNVGLDLQFSATDAQLEPATTCLSNQQNEVRGTYSFTARMSGRGEPDQLRSALKGDFQLSARDGEIVRAAGIDATFDYLNRTGDFAVNFPDLNKQAFPYQLLTVNGRIAGETIINDEIIIGASPYAVTGQGNIDVQRKQVDLKGLVSVALPVHQVIKSIPLIGAVVSGSIVGIPIRISGSLERPDVSYLSPSDVGAELLNLPMRILGAPLDALRIFAPSGQKSDKNITQ